MPKSISDWQTEIHQDNVQKGWWENERPVGSLLMLVVTELAEAFEEYRDNHGVQEVYFQEDHHGNMKPEGFPVELADTVIRIFDIAEAFGIDLESEIARKVEFNRMRPFKHGGKVE